MDARFEENAEAIELSLENQSEALTQIVSSFSIANSSLLKRRDLLRRVDTKFVVLVDDLAGIFREIEEHYSVVLANGKPWASYETLYFDTSDERFYNDHRRGALGRQKVRIRRYNDRHLNYFEVKLKSNRRITTKLRRRKDFESLSLESDDLNLASKVPSISGLKVYPRLWTNFSRLQLVGKEHVERVTIDLGVTFRHGKTGHFAALNELATSNIFSRLLPFGFSKNLHSLAIMEVKQPRLQNRTPVMMALKHAGVRQRSMSKYCTGVVLTSPETRAHRFLPNLKQVARLQCSS